MRLLLVVLAVLVGSALPAPAGTPAAEAAVHEFRVEGMTCALCARAIEKALQGVEGVKEVGVDRDAERVRVVADAGLSEDALVAAIEAAGSYRVQPIRADVGVEPE